MPALSMIVTAVFARAMKGQVGHEEGDSRAAADLAAHDEFSFDSLIRRFSNELVAHEGALICIKVIRGWENRQKGLLTTLLC
jgi:hypothetical protein